MGGFRKAICLTVTDVKSLEDLARKTRCISQVELFNMGISALEYIVNNCENGLRTVGIDKDGNIITETTIK